MLLKISTSHAPATDLGFLLHKNPSRLHSTELAFGTAHVFYPEASPDLCTAALFVDVDPVALVRGRSPNLSAEHPLAQYVNDRPYAASSLLSVALAKVFGPALKGRSKERPDLAAITLPFTAEVLPVVCKEGEPLLRRLFEPLGYSVAASTEPLDPAFPEWGDAPYWHLRLTGRQRLADLLCHLYVLIPALDRDKHYFIGDDEVEKLLSFGREWLPTHPERELIARRYLKNIRSLTRSAVSRLDEHLLSATTEDEEESARPSPPPLDTRRIETVCETIRELAPRSVLDLGCGRGRLLRALASQLELPGSSRGGSIRSLVGLEVSRRALDLAREEVSTGLAPMQQERLTFLHGSLTYLDERLEGFDAALLIEVIEHQEPWQLQALTRNVFGKARPRHVIVTTPNAEFNVRYAHLSEGRHRHTDHRFEWTRAQFRAWCEQVATEHGYRWQWRPVADEDPEVGPPTQMGVFSL
jgi:3' terminal RNA ribose 2'-O-methyltransferase Hen1